jgi:hypothetical protein
LEAQFRPAALESKKAALTEWPAGNVVTAIAAAARSRRLRRWERVVRMTIEIRDFISS